MRRIRTASVVAATMALLVGSLGNVSAQSEAEAAPTGEFTVKMMEPGVERVLDDGAGHDLREKYPKHRRDIDHIAVAPDGTVWLAVSAHGDDNSRLKGAQVWSLGKPGIYGKADGVPRDIGSMSFDASGNLWAFGSHIASFDGETWTRYETSTHATTPDGTVWLAADPGLESWDGTEFTRHLEMVWFGNGFVTMPDGSLMAMGHDGIYTLDGGEWTRRPHASARRAGAPDGSLWMISEKRGIEVLNGGEPSRYLQDTSINEIAAAPDGSIWAVGGVGKNEGGVYVIRPEALASAG